jgi:predicted carbohydrate-binding protein with CBM5 and CBM33 domain
MIRRPIRVLALVLLLCVVAAQAHFCVESSAARNTRHQCQLCRSSGWAVAEPDLHLDAQLACNPLPDKPASRGAQHQPIEASSSRAPPQS